MIRHKIFEKLSISPRNLVKIAAGAALGGALGYLYYATIGCSSGSCAIASDPVISTLWGTLIGGYTVAG